MPVTSVSDLVNLLAARRQVSILHDRRTGMPYSWSNWLQTRMSAAISSFTQADVITTAAARPLAPAIGVAPVVPLWRTMLLMFWYGGDPPPRDQRGLRWFAGFCSAGLHLLFALLLLWAALVSSNVPDERAEDGARVQIEYVGRGTPEEEGGGAPEASAAAAGQAANAAAAVAAAAESPAPPSPAASASVAAQDVAAAPAAPAAAEEAAESMPVDASKPMPEPAAEQPLQVTETTRPTSRFVVPPPAVAAPALRPREPQVQERTVETAANRPEVVQSVRAPVEVQPQLRAPQVQVRERQIEVAPQQPVVLAQPRSREVEVQLRSPDLGVAERQVETAPQQSVAMAAVRSREITSQVSAPQVAVRERQLPGVPDAPTATPKVGAGSAATTAVGSARADAAQSAGASTAGAAKADGPRSGTSTGAGPKPQDRSGGWAAPTRGDNWGASQRTVAGNAGGQADKGEGLFNADGTVRLAGSDGQGQDAKRGAPGGEADSWSRERIAQSGTWLKRPPYEHTPTSFDKYWVPSESLLAEWVRKGIKDIEIPIPGSNSKISCVISLLQFGGGCGLTNPNMQEQPAQARPPPNIPFKKELQEDNGSR